MLTFPSYNVYIFICFYFKNPHSRCPVYHLTKNQSNSKAIVYKLTAPVNYASQTVTFLCMLTGNAIITLDHQLFHLSDRDVLLILPDKPYHLESEASALILELHFDYLFFKEAFSESYPRIVCNSAADTDRDYSVLRMYIAQIALVHYSDLSENRFHLLSSIYQLFHYISTEFVGPIPDHDQPKNKQEKKLQKLLSYLHQNYPTSIALQDLADYMEITPQYLVRFMKQHLNLTFYECLNQIRLLAAAEQLQYTSIPPNIIALSCGFPNLSAFQKLFLHTYDLSPSEYRKNLEDSRQPSDLKQDAVISEPALAKDFITDNIHAADGGNSIAESSLKVVVEETISKSKPIRPTWMELINLGFPQNFEKPSFREHLTGLQSELHFRYGRIQGILDLIDSYSSEGTTTYSMLKIFRIIDFLRSIHMYPLFDLGNSSHIMYKEHQHIDELSLNRSQVDYNRRMKEFLPVLMKNCINRYGFQEVSLWKFELWMEYNSIMTIIEPPQAYAERFQFVYQTIKSFVPSAKVGGPGFNTFIPVSCLESTIRELIRRHLAPDFISFYLYPYIRPETPKFTESGAPFILLSKDKDLYKKYISQIRALINRHFTEKPELYATEYSTHISSRNYINDSTYQAAFIVKETLDNFSAVDALGYWTFSDISIEYGDSADILFGGNGLMSRNGIKKPSYYAFFLLKKLGDRLIGKGDHYIITAESDQSFQILAYHYSYFNERFCNNPKEFEILRNPSSAFEPLPPLDLTFRLSGLRDGTYTIRQSTVNQNHGNILHEWLRMDTPRDLSNDEIDYLKQISIPDLKISKAEVSDTLELSCHLTINNIILFEIDFHL